MINGGDAGPTAMLGTPNFNKTFAALKSVNPR